MNNLYVVTYAGESRIYTNQVDADECMAILGDKAVLTMGRVI
jgi:hypothetical protein